MFDRLHLLRAGLALYVPERARTRLRRLTESERGQAFVEYVLLLTLVSIAVVLIVEWGNFTTALKNAVNDITNVITTKDNANKGGT
jgi:Flp pilus assembly pilin Flp